MNDETMNNEQLKIPNPKDQIPIWAWRSVRWGFVILVIGLAGLIAAVALGVADPKPVGPLKWEDHFTPGRWETFGEARFVAGGLDVSGAEGGAVTAPESADFTFEAAAGQSGGEIGAAYGLVVGYQSLQNHIAVLINGNGYVQVISADGREWRQWGQWPNILLGTEANRLRVDVVDGEGLIRINDEVLLQAPVREGRVGVIARPSMGGQTVRFGWAKLWSR
jgi:hypothetical protein